MFLVRRVCEVERKNVWQVARLLRSMCRAYEENNGRAEAMIYVSGTGTPGKDVTLSAESVSYTNLTLPTICSV